MSAPNNISNDVPREAAKVPAAPVDKPPLTAQQKLLDILVAKTRFEREAIVIHQEWEIAQPFRLRVQHTLNARLKHWDITGNSLRFSSPRSHISDFPIADAEEEGYARLTLAQNNLTALLEKPERSFDAAAADLFLPHQTTHWELSECSNCHGAGKKKCYDCLGAGDKECYVCHGRTEHACDHFGCLFGQVSCSVCSGVGTTTHYESHIEQVQTWVNNETVYSSVTRSVPVTRTCYQCTVGKVPCPRCNGRSMVRCNTCFASGRMTCPTCVGNKYLRCSPCDGSGKVGVAACLDVHLETACTIALPDGADASALQIVENEGAVNMGKLATMVSLDGLENTANPFGIAAAYSGNFSINRLHAQCAEADYTLVAYGQDLRWLTMDDIVEDLLRRDLDTLQTTLLTSRAEGIFSINYASLLAPLRNVVASEVNADLIDAHLDGTLEQHAGASASVSLEYAEQVRAAKFGSLTLIYQRIAKSFWFKSLGVSAAAGLTVWASSNSLRGALTATLCALCGHFLFRRKARKILETAFEDRARALRSINAAAKSGVLRSAGFIATAPGLLLSLALFLLLPVHSPVPAMLKKFTSDVSRIGNAEIQVKDPAKRSASLSVAISQRRNGNFYAARETARKGSEAGDLDSRGLYSYMLLAGEGLKSSQIKADTTRFHEAAALAAQTLEKNPDDPWALTTKAVILSDSIGANGDAVEGLALLNRAAENGSPVALHKLGLSAANGTSQVRRDPLAARRFFSLALARGNTDSAWTLGQMDWYGYAAPVNQKSALNLWERCAKTGNETCEKAVAQGHP